MLVLMSKHTPGICRRANLVAIDRVAHFCSKTFSDYSLVLDVTTASATAHRGPCTVSGWIKTAKHQSRVSFIHLTDGLSSTHLQVILPSNMRGEVKDFKSGSSVKVDGHLVDSPGTGQELELRANKISLLGSFDRDSFPLITSKDSKSTEVARQYLHLRSKKSEFAAMLRLRSACKRTICNYFHNNNFIQIDTPVLTSNDCEGAGETFTINTPNTRSTTESYFGEGKNVNLTVSGQLHLEACNSGISKVFTFGPTFRADNAIDRTHLAEFYMLEGELSFIDGLADLMACVEDFTKSVSITVLNNEQSDINALLQGSTRYEPTDVSRYLSSPFRKITYTDAIQLIQNSSQQFRKLPKFGDDLNREHELYVLQAHDDIPVFVTDWPRTLKPFYMHMNDDAETVACMDLLVPGPGELFGGSVRESRYDVLRNTLLENNILKEYEWYLDLRRFGSAPHAGFGMGFERFLQFLFGVKHVRDTIPFPRYVNHCRL